MVSPACKRDAGVTLQALVSAPRQEQIIQPLTSPPPKFPGGAYEVDGILGEGGMAVVYRARDMRRPRAVAIKVLRAEIAQLIGTTRFLREIEMTAQFNHPNILPLLDSGEITDELGRITPYYVMPLVEGETLHERMVRTGRLPIADILKITREMLEALQYAHAKGVIHRDIKPANILVSNGHAVVADFGVARPVTVRNAAVTGEPTLTLAGEIVGTPTYMSPEQARGNGVVDARADLFSVGCVLYEMTVGVRPFDTPIPQYTNTRKMHGIYLPMHNHRPDVPAALDDVIAKALMPNPDDRFRSAHEFLEALSVITVNSKPAPSIRYRKTSRWVKWGGFAALLVAGVAAATPMAMRKFRANSVAPSTFDPGSELRRVAVLPLEQLTPDSLLGVLANGLQTDIIDELAQFPALTVISKNGVMQFQGRAATTDSVASVLKVGSLVTGDMRRMGDSVRVTVRLVDGATGEQRSKADASGTIRDMLTLRSSVLDSVTSFLRKAIGTEIGVRERQVVRSTEAWETLARLKGLTEVQQGFVVSVPPAERLARFAAIDSAYARAASLDEQWPAPVVRRASFMLARANFEDQLAAVNPTASASHRQLAKDFRLRALDLSDAALKRSPTNAEAFYLRGKTRFDLWRTATEAPDSLRTAAESDLRKAVSLREDLANAWNDLSLLLQLSGEYAASRDAANSALKADAFLSNADGVIANLLFTSLATGRTDQAIQWCERGRKEYPARPQFWGCELTILGWTGKSATDVGRAWELLEKAEARDTMKLVTATTSATRRLLIASIAARAALADSARAIIAQVRSGIPAGAMNANADYGEAYVRTILGEHDQAVYLLQRYLSANPALRGLVGKSPWFESLRNNSSFRTLTAPQVTVARPPG